MFFFIITFCSLSVTAAGQIVSPCQDLQEQRPCTEASSLVKTEIEKAIKSQKKLIFVFGSHRCGPCLAWRKQLSDQHLDLQYHVVYLPLSYYPKSRPTPDEATTQTCLQLRKTYQVELVPAFSRSSMQACNRKPSLMMIDPITKKGHEVDVRAVKQPHFIPSYLEKLKNKLNPSTDESLRDESTSRP